MHAGVQSTAQIPTVPREISNVENQKQKKEEKLSIRCQYPIKTFNRKVGVGVIRYTTNAKKIETISASHTCTGKLVTVGIIIHVYEAVGRSGF